MLKQSLWNLMALDHKPVLTSFNLNTNVTHKPFRFDKRLQQIPEFDTIVAEGWNSCKLQGRYSICDQIRNCRQAMSKGKHRTNMNAAKRIDHFQTRLNSAMESTISSERRCIPYLQRELAKAYRDEEIYWRTKSRKQWLKDGDRNTAYFHACTKTRYSKNYITSIQDEHHNIHRGDKEVGEHAQAYFKKVYTSSKIPVSPIDFGDFTPTVTHDINDELTRDFEEKEIYDAVCSIGDDKAPGPDGLTARFYKSYWNIIGEDVIKEARDFFLTSYMKPSINQTNICMIPKHTNAKTLSDYRPIALCNVLYKIISKCLVNRLKHHLGNIISDSQAAFIPGRLITDNILIAHEVMHSLKTRKRVSQNYMAVKTDVTKAYDRVEWGFLETTMKLFGFSDQWIEWIMATVRSVTYSVLVNGSPHGMVTPERGIRQGDPLSRYLFILCAV